ncbi:MAG TPA: plastocyanin/azurin family copper-binding protein [Tahibacter sp.]|nr:plastocyanin/azurin family copper-binding protein [Tahibacter sp.]
MRLKILAGILMAASWPALAQQTIQVGTPTNMFTPMNVTIQAGQTVTFQNVAGFHNVTSGAGAVTTFRCGPNGCDGVGGGNGEPGGGTWSQTVTFPTVGNVPFFCEVHGQSMSGVIQVNPVPVTLQSFDID